MEKQFERMMIMELFIWFGIFVFGVIAGVWLGRASIRKNSIFGDYYLDPEEHNIVMHMDENQLIENKSYIILRRRQSR